jgi:hypothetical protein
MDLAIGSKGRMRIADVIDDECLVSAARLYNMVAGCKTVCRSTVAEPHLESATVLRRGIR